MKRFQKPGNKFRYRWVSIAIISTIVALSAWAFSSPAGSSPDDDYHLPSIWCGQGLRDSLCEEDSKPGWFLVPLATAANSSCFAFQPEASGNCSYGSELTATPHINITRELYPPVYYFSMSFFASKDVANSSAIMRMVSVMIFVFGFATLILILPRHLRRVPLLSILLTSIPLGTFLISSTNPSGWAYFSLIGLFSSFLGFLSTSHQRNKIFLGIFSVAYVLMTAGSRSDAALFAIVAIALAYLLSSGPGKMSVRDGLATLVLTGLSFFFYITNGQASGVISGSLALPNQNPNPPSMFQNLANLPELWLGAFGKWGLGWLDTPLPVIVWAITASAYGVVVFASVRWFDWKQATAASLVLLALIAVPLYILTVSQLSVGEQVQPRYLLPLLALLCAVALFRERNGPGLRLSRGQALILAAGLFGAHLVSLHTNIRRYTTGLDVNGVNLDRLVEWWWPESIFSPNGVWSIGSIAFALLLFSLWKLRSELGLPGEKKQINHEENQVNLSPK